MPPHLNQHLGIPRRDDAHSSRADDVGAAHSSSAVTPLDRWLVRKILAATQDMPISIELWNGEIIEPEHVAPPSGIRLNSRRALLQLIRHPTLSFGDLYCAGDLEVKGELSNLLLLVRPPMTGIPNTLMGLLRRICWRNIRPRTASVDQAKDNIHHHYDLGNDFYELWLDQPAMQYTCAYFPDPAMTLEAAQAAKMHHVCRKLRLQPEQTVVEAGCGWGGFALFMAREYGVNVRAYNISHEQIIYARKQAQAQDLADQVEFIEDDYRNIEGEFDVFVSVGMLEHVGLPNYRALGEVINRTLRESGLGLIHSIGRNVPLMMNAWMEKRIFPGAYPPTLREMADIFEPSGLSILDVENLRLHYAKTLEHWLSRFEGNIDEITKQFDEPFVRAWRLYLTGSMTSFLNGDLQLFQLVFSRSRNNAVAWSRSHVYGHGDS
jgi:cyclopropane-fatty-acyl-phospholipid synthase